MTTPVFYHQATGGIPVANQAQLQVVGSVIAYLDFALVNGGNQLNIVSINRTVTSALVKTSANHVYTVGEVVHLENTGEPNFNGKFFVETVPNPDEITITVADISSASTGAVGTIKHAAAGWTKEAAGTNTAVYKSALMYDGTYRYIQIEDNGPYGGVTDFRVRIAKGWTAMDTASKISAQRRFSKIAGHGKWFVAADDKSIIMGFNGANLYGIGYGKETNVLDAVPFYLSSGADASTQGINFGTLSNAPNNQLIGTASGSFIDSITGIGTDSLFTGTILGSLESASSQINTKQAFHRAVNPLDGSIPMIPVDLWEKISDTGQTHTLRCRVRGMYQPYGKIPTDYIANSVEGFFKFKANNFLGKNRNMVMVTSASLTSNQVAIDLTGDW